MNNIVILEQEKAKKYIKENCKELTEYLYIIEWLKEENVKLYLLFDENILKSFVLLSKLKHDPLKIHENPYYLNYIYTFENFRRKGNAFYIASEIKTEQNITVFCVDDMTQNLFKKAGYIFNDYDPLYKALPIYRYP